MSTRTVLIVVLALLFGGSAAIGINLVRNQAAPVETVDVVVAVADIPRGTTLLAEHVKLRAWPRELVPPGALASLDQAQERVSLLPVVKEEVLLDAKLAPRSAGRGLAAMIPPGLRAFTIQAPHVASGVAGFILPGNKVDVLLTMTGSGLDDGTDGGSTVVLLQRVEVLAVDQRLDAPADNKVDPQELRSVTLLVTPEQAAKLDLGQSKGTLHLSLRNPADSAEAHSRPVTVRNLRLRPEKPWGPEAGAFLTALGKLMAQSKERPKGHAMTIVNGSTVTQHEFRRQGQQYTLGAEPAGKATERQE
jgi:pilus assembly protein CpaB